MSLRRHTMTFNLKRNARECVSPSRLCIWNIGWRFAQNVSEFDEVSVASGRWPAKFRAVTLRPIRPEQNRGAHKKGE